MASLVPAVPNAAAHCVDRAHAVQGRAVANPDAPRVDDDAGTGGRPLAPCDDTVVAPRPLAERPDEAVHAALALVEPPSSAPGLTYRVGVPLEQEGPQALPVAVRHVRGRPVVTQVVIDQTGRVPPDEAAPVQAAVHHEAVEGELSRRQAPLPAVDDDHAVAVPQLERSPPDRARPRLHEFDGICDARRVRTAGQHALDELPAAVSWKQPPHVCGRRVPTIELLELSNEPPCTPLDLRIDAQLCHHVLSRPSTNLCCRPRLRPNPRRSAGAPASDRVHIRSKGRANLTILIPSQFQRRFPPMSPSHHSGARPQVAEPRTETRPCVTDPLSRVALLSCSAEASTDSQPAGNRITDVRDRHLPGPGPTPAYGVTPRASSLSVIPSVRAPWTTKSRSTGGSRPTSSTTTWHSTPTTS